MGQFVRFTGAVISVEDISLSAVQSGKTSSYELFIASKEQRP